jgi:hypothetical protein
LESERGLRPCGQACYVPIGFGGFNEKENHLSDNLCCSGWVHDVGIPSRAQTQSQCSVESKDQYYKAFLESHEGQNKDQAKALEAAKKYLSCRYDPGDGEDVLAKLNLAVGRILSSKNSNSEHIEVRREE